MSHMKDFDCVVVGAGNAGIVAALRLAYGGKKTLLIEQHNLPGGVASSFRRGRFEFDPSLHELCDLGPEDSPGSIRRLFNKLGVKVDWIEIPECFRVISTWSEDGEPMDVSLPCGIKEFIEKTVEYVPESRKSVEGFFELCEETLAGIEYTSRMGAKADPMEMAKRFPNFLKAGALSVTEVYDLLEMPSRARDILNTYWSYYAIDADHCAFVHYIAMTYKYIDKKPYMPTHTAHEISTAVVERFRELGGEFWTNCRAEEFLFDGDVCCGVRTNRGDIYCDQVLANINPHILYGKMVPKALVPEREKKLANAREFSGRAFVAYFGLSKTAEELGIKDYTVFLCDTADSVKTYEDMKTMDKNTFSIMVCQSVLNPKFAPEGGCILSFTSMYGSDVWGDVEVEDYVAAKNKIAARMMNDMKEKMGVDIAPYVEEMCVASPWTMARYTGNPEGCVYGYETKDWDAMMARMMMIGYDYPIKHLRPIGAAGPQGDGYSSTYIVGDMFAKIVLREMEKEGGAK